MPLNLYTGAALNKLNKSDLKCHIIDLYGFIKVFDGQSIIKLKEENEKLKKENEDKDHRILTWKMSKALADTEIKELKKN